MDRKILIVDDEVDIREILQFNLENAGFNVECASSAEEALEKLTPDFALILLDVMMHGMSGFQMAQLLRNERDDHTPIIFLTAKDTQEDLLTGFSSGADDYIPKPFRPCVKVPSWQVLQMCSLRCREKQSYFLPKPLCCSTGCSARGR